MTGKRRTADASKGTRTRWKPIKASYPNQIWETDIVYVWCGHIGVWRCVHDTFARQWTVYRFSTLSAADLAMESTMSAVSDVYTDCPTLALQCDNGSRHAGKLFQNTASLLGINPTFVRTGTPGQKGYIESIHGSIRREYVRPRDSANYHGAKTVMAWAFGDCTLDGPRSTLRSSGRVCGIMGRRS